MKIGIYGDSYAGNGDVTLSSNWINSFIKLVEEDSKEKITLYHYALGGSSLYYSYKKFLETKNKCDLVIFLATEPHRYIDRIKISGSYFAFVCKSHVEDFKKTFTDLDDETKKKLDAIIGWFDASVDEHMVEMSDLMIQKIETSHNNIIIYPCFPHSFKLERFNKYEMDPLVHPCHNFWYKQLEIFNIDPKDFTAKEKQTLFGHLVPEFNKYFAELLFTKYKTGKFKFSSYDNIKIDKSKEYYYANWD